jgi:hypothetical protein
MSSVGYPSVVDVSEYKKMERKEDEDDEEKKKYERNKSDCC